MTPKNEAQAQLEYLLKGQQEIIQRLETLERYIETLKSPRLLDSSTEVPARDPITQAILDRSQEIRTRRWKKMFGGFNCDDFQQYEVLPACEILFPQRGIKIRQTLQNMKYKKEDLYLTIGLMLSNDSQIIIVFTRETIQTDHIDDLIEDLSDFRRCCPEYQRQQLYGAVAGMNIEDGADEYAYRQGLFLLAKVGETVAILNGADFEPKSW
jgi:hypothetical protein